MSNKDQILFSHTWKAGHIICMMSLFFVKLSAHQAWRLLCSAHWENLTQLYISDSVTDIAFFVLDLDLILLLDYSLDLSLSVWFYMDSHVTSSRCLLLYHHPAATKLTTLSLNSQVIHQYPVWPYDLMSCFLQETKLTINLWTLWILLVKNLCDVIPHHLAT